MRLPRLSWQSWTPARDEERGPAHDQEKEGDKDATEAEWFTPLVVASFAVALLAVVGYALAEDWNIQILALALLIAGGAFVTGGLFGFLFGIPRALTGRAEDDVESGRGYGANTNLEQISDWLTKILVGVGLVQITTIGRHFGDLITSLGPALGGDPYGESFAAATIIIFGVSGFLVFYLLTRIDLPPALARADRLSVRTLKRELAEVRQTAEEVKQTQREQEERDVRALTLLGRQLTPEAGAPSIKQDELDEAIAGASPLVRIQIFGRAREQRRLTRESDKVSMERTIPVFRALIASENERKFHRSHAQLGYALLDQRQPDLSAAETRLTEAIELRNDANEPGFLLYEFARALARIGQYRTNPSPELRAKIEADLKAAEASGSIRKIMAGSTEGASAIKEFRAAQPSSR